MNTTMTELVIKFFRKNEMMNLKILYIKILDINTILRNNIFYMKYIFLFNNKLICEKNKLYFYNSN